MATRAKSEEYRTPPELIVASALRLVSHLPNAKRAAALRILAEKFRVLYAESDEPHPEWLQMLSELAEKEETSEVL